jgi:hypothetical protein
VVTTSLLIAPGTDAGLLRIPADFATVGDAALVAGSGDTIQVSRGFHALTGAVTLRSGVVLRAEGPADSTQLGLSIDGDQLRLGADSPDTTIVEGLRFLFNSCYGNDGIWVQTPAAIVRGNQFLDLCGYGIGAATVRLDAGGVVEHNRFVTGSTKGIIVDGGRTLIRYNTWNYECGPANQITIDIIRSSVASSMWAVMIRRPSSSS